MWVSKDEWCFPKKVGFVIMRKLTIPRAEEHSRVGSPEHESGKPQAGTITWSLL